MPYNFDPGPPIIIIRLDFQKLFQYSELHEPLRNQLIIDLPCKMGLRSGEITRLLWQDLDIKTGRLIIRDSKSKRRYPIPVNYTLAQKLEEYREEQDYPKKGLLMRRFKYSPFSQKHHNRPMHPTNILRVWHKMSKRAELENPKMFTPRLGRHYFAADWSKRGGNMEVLRRILRHKNLAYTQIYLSRLVFYEDVKQEFDRIYELPMKAEEMPLSRPANVVGNGPAIGSPSTFRESCHTCDHFGVCKYKEAMAQLPVADCRMRETRKPDLPSIQFLKPSRKRAHRGQPYYR